jgi:predicted ATP-dependent Lon-type protease
MAKIKGLFGIAARVVIMAVISTKLASAQQSSGHSGVASFLSAVNSANDELKALSAEKSVSAHDIHLVSVQQLTNPGNSTVITKAIGKNSSQIAALREALKNNSAVMAALAAGNVSLDQVIALEVQPGSEIHIYYR